jgi:hypothetical protein
VSTIEVTMTPKVAKQFYELDGEGQERVLTVALRNQDPDVIRVHVHAGEYLIQYPDRVVRFDRLDIYEESPVN